MAETTDEHPGSLAVLQRLTPGPPAVRPRSGRWFDALPDVAALEVLGSLRVDPAQAGRVVGARPVSGDLLPAVRTLLDG